MKWFVKTLKLVKSDVIESVLQTNVENRQIVQTLTKPKSLNWSVQQINSSAVYFPSVICANVNVYKIVGSSRLYDNIK